MVPVNGIIVLLGNIFKSTSFTVICIVKVPPAVLAPPKDCTHFVEPKVLLCCGNIGQAILNVNTSPDTNELHGIVTTTLPVNILVLPLGKVSGP